MDLRQAPVLSRREREVLKGLVRGMSRTEIARALWVSDRTIAFHVENINRKLGSYRWSLSSFLAWLLPIGVDSGPTLFPL